VESADQPSVAPPTSTPDDIVKLRERVAELEKQAQSYLDGWKRARADYLNLKREMEEEKQGWLRMVQAGMIEKLIEPREALRSAIQFAGTTTPEGMRGFREGLEAVEKQFQSIFTHLGVKEVGSVGEVFDPRFHEAQEFEGEKRGGVLIVTRVLAKGYVRGEMVLRPAKVSVREQSVEN